MEAVDCILDDELLVANDDFICDFCSLEFPSSSARTEHILQHFRQTNCSACGEILICIDDIWYGPHTASNCCMANADVASEVAVTDEETLPDYIEVKQEEIVDICDEEEEVNDYDGEEIGMISADNEPDENDTRAEMDDEAQYQMPGIPNEDSLVNVSRVKTKSLAKRIELVKKRFKVDRFANCKMTPIHHQNKCIGFKSELRGKNLEQSLVQKQQQEEEEEEVVVEEDYELEFNNDPFVGEELTLRLTQDQLDRRQCPICFKVIINKTNLICHMNIHSGAKPFVCEVCQKGFAHIRNLNRHKEQQGHSDFQFKCFVKGCGELFISSNKMNRHMKLHHRKINKVKLPHQCPQCEKGFTSPGYLRMHIEKGHRLQSE